jgi:hypothetical protein
MSTFGDSENRQKYWDGPGNKAIRYYFYIQRGLGFLNEFRNLIMGILGIYFVLKMNNPIILIIMFILSIPVLILIGWLSVHKISKVTEFLNIEYSTYWSRHQFEIWEDMLKHLETIAEREKLENTHNSPS